VLAEVNSSGVPLASFFWGGADAVSCLLTSCQRHTKPVDPKDLGLRYDHASTNLGNRTMNLTRIESSVQVTYTPKEYDEFNLGLVSLRNEIRTTLTHRIASLDNNDREYWRTLKAEFVQALEYIDSATIAIRTEGGFQLIWKVEEFEKFTDNLRCLRMDLGGFQEWHHRRGEYEKEKALDAAQDVINTFFRLLGYSKF
jgi:hypothetical protein